MVVSAPSGAGKTTLCQRLVREMEGVVFSVSHTTRAPRFGERNGVDYHFVGDDTFSHLVERDAFLEWAWVHGHRYGTARVNVQEQIAQGVDVLLDVDVQGGRQINARLDGVVLVFVLPPTLAVLESRLRGRASETDDAVRERLAVARQEIEVARFYTHLVINDELPRAVDDLRAILRAERCRQVGNGDFPARFLHPPSAKVMP